MNVLFVRKCWIVDRISQVTEKWNIECSRKYPVDSILIVLMRMNVYLSTIMLQMKVISLVVLTAKIAQISLVHLVSRNTEFILKTCADIKHAVIGLDASSNIMLLGRLF